MAASVVLTVAGVPPLTLQLATEPLPDYDGAPAPESNGETKILQTVGDLRSAINELTHFDGNQMKLIYKGKMLGNDAQEHLSKYGFKNNDKIMGLGKPRVEPVEDVGLKQLRKYEKEELVKLEKNYDDIKVDMGHLEQNFLNAAMTAEMITKLRKRVLAFNEMSEKHMEKIDGIQIFDDNTPEEIKKKNREVRKAMINGIHDYLNLNDKFKFRLEQLKSSLEDRKD